VCISQINKGRWQEMFVPAEKAEQFISSRSSHKTDQYISVNEFNKSCSRKEKNITQLRSLYCDIDVKHNNSNTAYNVNTLTDFEAWEIMSDVTDALSDANIPTPTLIINSGRGLQLYWSFNPVPYHYINQYKRAQRKIYIALKGLGADSNALDASRVLRIPNTLNTKSNTYCSILGGNEYVNDFFDLTSQIQCDDITSLNALKTPFKRKAHLNNVDAKNNGHISVEQVVLNYAIKKALKESLKPKYAKSTNPTQALHNARLSDYTKLLEVKYNKQAPNGKQDMFLFLATVSLANLNTNNYALKQAALEFNSKYIGFDEKSALAVLSTILKLHEEKKIYKYSSAKIIQLLDICEDDMDKYNLRTLITKELRYKRKNAKRSKVTRDEYLKANCVSAIARKLGKNRRTIKRWLENGKIKAENYI